MKDQRSAVIIDCQEKGKICGQQWLTTLSGCKIHRWLSSVWMQLFKTSSSTVPQICFVWKATVCHDKWRCRDDSFAKKSWANLSMWSALAVLVSMPRTPRMPNFHSCFTNGSEMSFRAKKLHSHAAQLTGRATAFLHRQKHPWNHLHDAQVNASLFGRTQAMRWANSHDETSLTGCLTALFHQGVYWSPPPQGLSGHRRCWRALNIVHSDYNSPTWTKNLSRAELILCMIAVFRCSRSVLKYSAPSDLSFN